MKYFFKLIRYPNLLILLVSQYLIRFFVIKPLLALNGGSLVFSELNFALLVLATLLISGAGYIINDYFDLESDKINKPIKQVLEVHISIEHARLIYFIMNLAALGIGVYLAMQIGIMQYALIFLIIILMLWYYSARYKRMLFWGNFVVSALSAFAIFIVWLFEFNAFKANPNDFIENLQSVQWINYFIYGYVFFAFISSLIREIIKDIEDVEGDMSIQCKTIPIVVGTRIAKFIINALILVTVGVLIYAQINLWNYEFYWVFWFLAIAVQPLLLYLAFMIYKARSKVDFSVASAFSKVVMLAGILSMIFIMFK